MENLSVILPVYNDEKYIFEAIESIVNQTYKEFELLCIYDNGSKDKSRDIIRKISLKDSRVKYIDLKEKRGLVTALNYGISISNGKYIARMDADDIADKKRFEKQMNYLTSHKEVDILGTYVKTIGDVERGKEFNDWVNRTWTKDNAKKGMIEKCILIHPSVMMKKSVLIKLNGYREKYDKMEDCDLWLRAINAGFNISTLGEELLSFRVHEESKSTGELKDSRILTEQRVNMKLEHYEKEIVKDSKDKEIYIWGCGEGGKVTFEVLREKGIEIKGFIDSFKKGYFENKIIYDKSELIDSNKESFIYIATLPGYNDAKKFLEINNIKSFYII